MAKSNSTVPLLGLILAIPAVACYVWWTHLNTETKRQLSLRVRSRTDGVRFSASPDRNKLDNPITAGPAAAAVAPAASSSTAPAAPPSASAAAAKPAPPAAVLISSAATQAGSSAGIDGPPVITRDPTISPFDVVRMQQLEYEKEQRRLELEGAAARSSRRHREASVESRLELQGIISGGRGNRAIVNGDTVGVGDAVAGAKVLRITAQSVVFAYKGRRFTKTISK